MRRAIENYGDEIKKLRDMGIDVSRFNENGAK
jgi:hypothetical protein